MKIDVKTKDAEGNIVFEGALNRKEVGFLLAYAMYELMASGVEFNMLQNTEDIPDDEDERPVRFAVPGNKTVN